MEIRDGNYLINRGNQQAIIEIGFPNFLTSVYAMYVFQGNHSEFDFLVKYKKNNGRIRTPKHIHWVVDILMKFQGNRELTRQYLNSMVDYWNNCSPLRNNDYTSFENLINNDGMDFDIVQFQELSNYGEYPIDFLHILMKLLAVQEKTNRNDAYMFGSIIRGLLSEQDMDIFSVVSKAGFSGRR